MTARAQHSLIPWPALFFALLGLVWCGFVAFPTANPAPCATAGCALFRDSKIAGVSLWWVGGALFFILTILCLRGQRAAARLLARLALFVDAILLIVMYFTAPCLDCLVVAALIALCFFFLRPNNSGWFLEDASPSLLLPVWIGLFIGNCAVVVNEQMPQYTLGNAATAQVRLYFSPSCPACREAVQTLGPSALLYPVEEREGDFEAILRFENLLAAGLSPADALRGSLQADNHIPSVSLPDQLIMHVQLLRNKAAVLRQGFRALPLIEVNGMPGFKGQGAVAKPEETPVGRHAPATEQPRGSDQTPESVNGTAHEHAVDADRPDGHLDTAPTPTPPEQNFPPERNAGVPDFLNHPDNLGQCGSNADTPCQ
jgi:hypothetical protein